MKIWKNLRTREQSYKVNTDGKNEKKKKIRRTADFKNLERTSKRISHSAACEYCRTDHAWLYICMKAVILTSENIKTNIYGHV